MVGVRGLSKVDGDVGGGGGGGSLVGSRKENKREG
jgi:hypothetical protein